MLQKFPREGFLFLPRTLLFSDLKKLHFHCTEAIPSKKVWCPLTPGVPHLYRLQLSQADHISFSASSLISECRRPCRATWALCSVFPSQSQAQASVYSGGTEMTPALVSGALPRLCSSPIFQQVPSLLLVFCSKLSNAVFFAPFFSCLKRLQFYWNVILHPELKWSLSVSYYLIYFW